MRDFKDKVAVITGAASGIGEALAHGLAAKGAVLALVDFNPERLEAVAADLKNTGATVSTHTADVGSRKRMEALPAEIVAIHGGVDILINNAGVTVGSMFVEHSLDDAEWLLQTNLLGVIYGCKLFLPHLLAAPQAHIVNLSSMFGIFSMPGQAMYSTSKAGVRAFTEALWTELADSNVRLTVVHPGGVKTRVIEAARMPDPAAQARAVELQERYGMPVDRAAAHILRAVEHDKLRVIVGADARVAVALKRLFPVGFQRLITVLYRRFALGDLTGGTGKR